MISLSTTLIVITPTASAESGHKRKQNVLTSLKHLPWSKGTNPIYISLFVVIERIYTNRQSKFGQIADFLETLAWSSYM